MKKTKGNMEAQALGCKVGRAYQVMLGQLAGALREAGLDITTSEYLVLRAVYSRPGVQQCEIAEMVGKDKAAVCRCVGALENRGLVNTETVSHKCLRVYPSAKGREMEPRIMDVAAKRHGALVEMTSPEELEVFNLILDTIIKSK